MRYANREELNIYQNDPQQLLQIRANNLAGLIRCYVEVPTEELEKAIDASMKDLGEIMGRCEQYRHQGR